MAKPPGRCVFCGATGVTAEHIWSAWLDEVIPRGWDRYEAALGVNPGETVPRRRKKGAVHTKKARKVCKPCNTGWMSQIVDGAKPHAAKLIKGEEITLGEDEQLQVASWLALAAMMADQLARSRLKFPGTDLSHMFCHHAPPPHWYIAIGLYEGPEIVACDQSPLGVHLEDVRTGEKHLDFVVHSVTTIIGRLFTIIHAINPSSHRLAGQHPWSLHYPHLRAIWPRVSPLPFPPPRELVITGSFNPDGGLARDLATRLRNHTHASMVSAFGAGPA